MTREKPPAFLGDRFDGVGVVPFVFGEVGVGLELSEPEVNQLGSQSPLEEGDADVVLVQVQVSDARLVQALDDGAQLFDYIFQLISRQKILLDARTDGGAGVEADDRALLVLSHDSLHLLYALDASDLR